MYLISLFYSIYLWIFLVFNWVAIFPFFILFWIVTRPFDRNNYWIHLFTAYWGRLHIWFFPTIQVKIHGKNNLLKNRPCVFVVNHMSMLDIVTVFYIYHNFTWVSKKENFQVPILGWVMKLNNYISIDRNDPKRLTNMLDDCSKAIKRGEPVMVFPEGTRSKTGKMGPFKDGAFQVAIENKVPIVPVVMNGNQYALPKHGFVVKPREVIIDIKILPPIEFNQFETNDPKLLKNNVFQLMNRELAHLQSNI